MFAIALQQKQYKTYILSDQVAQSRIEVVPERGGIVTSWQVQGQEILYLDAERFANPNLTVRGGIPILFPICGNLPDNTYFLQGQQHTLKQHGFARDLAWEVTEKVTQNLASITLVLNSNDQTRASYPFDFQVAFTYLLKGNQLEIHQHYSNHSDKVMPFSTGLHPYFLAPHKSQLQFQIPATQYIDQRTLETHPFAGTFDFEQEEIDAAFRQITAQSTTVTQPAPLSSSGSPVQLTLDYDAAYRTLVFWTLKGKDFYCLEPWTAPRNALNTGEHLLHLEPGASLKTWVRLTAHVQ